MFITDFDLPSFLWLWKIAAWSMGFAIAGYLILFLSGSSLMYSRVMRSRRPVWLRPLHLVTGGITVLLVLLLLFIGLIGTIGHYGSLGHSSHLIAGLLVVFLMLLSGWSALQISPNKPWARALHLRTNIVLLGGFIFVSITGWQVVQKYLS